MCGEHFHPEFFFCTLLTTADGLQRAIRLELIGYQFYSTYCNVAILLLIIPVVTINITIIKDPFLSSHLSFSLAGSFLALRFFIAMQVQHPTFIVPVITFSATKARIQFPL